MHKGISPFELTKWENGKMDSFRDLIQAWKRDPDSVDSLVSRVRNHLIKNSGSVTCKSCKIVRSRANRNDLMCTYHWDLFKGIVEQYKHMGEEYMGRSDG